MQAYVPEQKQPYAHPTQALVSAKLQVWPLHSSSMCDDQGDHTGKTQPHWSSSRTMGEFFPAPDAPSHWQSYRLHTCSPRGCYRFHKIPVPPAKFASIRNALSRKWVIVIIIFKSGVCFPTTLPPNKQTFSLGNGSQCGPHSLTDALTPTASRTQAKHLHPTKLPLRHRGSSTPSF